MNTIRTLGKLHKLGLTLTVISILSLILYPTSVGIY